MSVALLMCGGSVFDGRLLFVGCFAADVTAAQFDFTPDFEVSKVSVWFGKVSYSLYLVHALVIAAGVRLFGSWGAVALAPAILPVAWVAWRFVERPSIAASRMIGRPKSVRADNAELMAREC